MKELRTIRLINYKAFKFNFNIELYFYIDKKTVFVFKEKLEKNQSNRGNYIQSGNLSYIDGWLYGAVQCKCKVFNKD